MVSCLSFQRGSSGVELWSFGLIAIRSQERDWKTVPAVSIVTLRPRARQWAASAGSSGTSIGSPPVRTTSGAELSAMRWKSSSSVHAVPSGFHDVYGVSQNQQRRLHPDVRIKSERVPAHGPSPWIDSKISAICMA